MPHLPLIAMDLEGVFIPEIWIAVAEKTQIPRLRLTTRDEPDYDVLMRGRLAILREHGLRLADIQSVIETLDPLPGAVEFLDWMRTQAPVIILSDTFSQFATPLLGKLHSPTILCNTLHVDDTGMLDGYTLRQQDGKRKAVQAFQQIGYRVLAAGDSYNDTTMLGVAERGVLFCPPQNVIDEFPHFPVAADYDTMREHITRFLAHP